jgi:hypothetical protein
MDRLRTIADGAKGFAPVISRARPTRFNRFLLRLSWSQGLTGRFCPALIVYRLRIIAVVCLSNKARTRGKPES